MISRVVPLFMIVLTFCTFHSFHILKLNWTKNVVPKGLCASCNWNATKHSNLDTLTDRTPSTEHMCFSQKLPILCDYSISSDECEAFFEGNKPPPSVHSIRIPENASVDDEISAECDRIRERGYYANEAFSSEEREFPLAFVRVVYKEYHLQELLLNLMWSPQNFYCYALDKQSSPLFHEQMKNLSHCFDNVVLTSVEYPVKSSGWNMYSSILECLKVIIEKSGWKYAIILQNHDIPIKTNREIVDILKLFNGSNDIAVYAQSKRRTPRFDNWTYAALHLFKDESLNDNRTIKIAKGNIGCSLSRPFVEFIVRELNLIELIRRFESIGYGSDEMLFPTLHSNDELNAPGGYTYHCLKKFSSSITRHVIWPSTKLSCRSRMYRHLICVFGLQDLITLPQQRYLFANKMMPTYDYSAISCWARYLYYRIHNHTRSSMNMKFYSNMAVVRFNRNKHIWRQNISLFKC